MPIHEALMAIRQLETNNEKFMSAAISYSLMAASNAAVFFLTAETINRAVS
jgi:hypothetical protein